MSDQWYFEIGDGQTYGPFSLEKLQKWAASGQPDAHASRAQRRLERVDHRRLCARAGD